MIKIDKEITEIKGTELIIATEIGCLFNCLNMVIDKSRFPQLLEEMIICDDNSFEDFCKLAIRLNEAHKRCIDRKKTFKE